MKKLYYIRHGQSETNKNGQWGGQVDTPLTPEGHAQAKAAAKAAKEQGLKFDVIVSSPLQRAHNTAKHIANHVDYPHEEILIQDLLKERSYGVMDGKKVDPKIKILHKTDEALIDDIEGVERLVDFQKRADKAYQYLQSLPHDNILVVAHGGFGRALWRAVNNEPIHVRGVYHENAKLIRLI
jgi:broad specificity phosphatase PhoE